MSKDLLYRLVALGVCGVFLVGLFVLGGMGYPAPTSPGPDLADEDVVPGDHAGEHVETGGDVIATDPVVIEVGNGDTSQPLPIENAPEVEKGQDVVVDGTLTGDGTLEANPERAVVREPWETTYMYLVSLLGALIVAVRLVDGWRFNPRRITFVPRETPLHKRYLREATDG